MEFMQWWTAYEKEVAYEIGRPNEKTTPEDVAAAQGQPWMAGDLEEFDERLYLLINARLGERPTPKPDMLEEFVNPVVICIPPELFQTLDDGSLAGPAFDTRTGRLSFPTADDLARVHTLWEAVPKAKSAGLKHPLAALIEGWLRYQMARPQNMRVLLSDEKSMLARSINHHKTAALATWEDGEAVFVEVDAEAMASVPPQAPARAIGFPPRDQPRGTLLPLPGERAATDLRLLWAWNFDQLGFDRRKTIAADLFYLLTLSGAMIDKVIVPVADVGAWLRGDFSAEGLGRFHRKQRWERGMAGLLWATRRLRLADGTIMPLLEINQLGVEDDKIFSAEVVELRPWGWAKWKALHGRIPNWRLTGGLAHCELRYDKTGMLARVLAGMEDCLAVEAGAYLNPQVRASLTLPYVDVLARAGLVFDMADPVQNDRTRQQWRRVMTKLQQRGYCLPSKGWHQAESPAGDTIEIVSFGHGTVIFRASARWCEAQRKVATARGDTAFTGVRFRELFN